MFKNFIALEDDELLDVEEVAPPYRDFKPISSSTAVVACLAKIVRLIKLSAVRRHMYLSSDCIWSSSAASTSINAGGL